MGMNYKLKDYYIVELGLKNSKLYILKLLSIILYSPSKRALFYVRTMLYLKEHNKFNFIIFWLRKKLILTYGCYISPNSKIGIGLIMPHPNGIVIGDGSVLGSNVVIYQQVTIGAQRRGEGKMKLYPTIQDNCIIYAGVKILGPILIGNNSIIGANAVVTKSFENNSTIVGIPGRAINE